MRKKPYKRLLRVLKLESEKMRMMQLNLDLGENLEDLHQERECQRSARQPRLSWENTLKICESPTTTRNWNVNGLLEEVEDCWHFHQLLRQLRFAKRGC